MFSKSWQILIVALGLVMLKSCTDDASYDNIAGEWEGLVFTGDGNSHISMTLTQEDEKVSGHFYVNDQFEEVIDDSGTIEGVMDGDQFTGHAYGTECSPDIDLTLVHPDTLSGHVHMGACDEGATHELTIYKKPTL